MKKNTSRIGSLGERIASRYLEKQGYRILEMNYRKPWGEIDIVGTKNGVLTFFEVKALEKKESPFISPEDQVGGKKKKRLARAIETYMNERGMKPEQSIAVDVLALELDFERKKSKIRHIRNISFDRS